MDQNAKQQIVDRLKEANNVLVTVSANPSVDQLAACIGVTLFLNKAGKHATAVFSGKVPDTLEFLKPDQTIETDTNSLRDFIIALDKSKADKLRYKVEDKVVKIFITPYRTSLTDKDLEFSQGDFNVDAVIGIGVRQREDLDQAIMAHGRILHDATVISVNNKDQGNLGTINWVNLNASSLSEMMVEVASSLSADKMDGQMATAFLTGIVAETNRFSNDKTSAQTMTIASELMSAGANQQLIASQLEAATTKPAAKSEDKKDTPTADSNEDIEAAEDGSLHISHEEEKPETPDSPKTEITAKDVGLETPKPDDEPSELPPVMSQGGVKHTVQPDATDLHDDGPMPSANPVPPIIPSQLGSMPTSPAGDLGLPPTPSFPKLGKAEDRRATQEEDNTRFGDVSVAPPTTSGKLSANTEPEHLQVDPSTDPLSMPMPSQSPLFSRSPASSVPPSAAPMTVPSPGDNPVSPLAPAPAPAPEPVVPDHEKIGGESIEQAREEVSRAIQGDVNQPLTPIEGLGAQPIDLNKAASPGAPAPLTMPLPSAAPAVDPSSGLPPSLVPPATPTDNTAGASSPSAPPPVPPPLMPPSGNL